jgi:hypothetical protein
MGTGDLGCVEPTSSSCPGDQEAHCACRKFCPGSYRRPHLTHPLSQENILKKLEMGSSSHAVWGGGFIKCTLVGSELVYI